MSSARTITLPDLFAVCPLETGRASPHYEAAAAESSAWVNSYNFFTDRKRLLFVLNSNELLCCRTYPYARYEQFRTCCDYVNLLFVIDEVSDEQNGQDAKQTGEVFIRGLTDPDFDDGSLLAKMTKEFRARLVSSAVPKSIRRFFKHFQEYIQAVSREAELRERREVLNLESFIKLRRENSAVRTAFGLFEYVLGIELPDEVFDDPIFQSVYFAAVDMVCYSNDVYSYNMERAMGHTGNNIVTVVMKEKGLDVQEAVDYVGSEFKRLMETWEAGKANMPSWGPAVDKDVTNYIAATGQWVIGNLEWSFETQRYFGAERDTVRLTRTVTLKPAPEEV